jgi:hypothetical protein
MGAYGHARWREFILGGATKSLLSKPPLPILFSHCRPTIARAASSSASAAGAGGHLEPQRRIRSRFAYLWQQPIVETDQSLHRYRMIP